VSPSPRGSRVEQALATILCLFTLAEVNYPHLSPQSQLAIFALLGLLICFHHFPFHPRLVGHPAGRAVDGLFALATLLCCGYVIVQTEPVFQDLWFSGQSLGDRAGAEVPLDHAVGIAGLLIILEATRRAVGPALPILALVFLAYAGFGQTMPDWLFPHRGYSLERIVAQTFLHSQGVFGIALRVMFTYVFLFVVFGAFLEATGATRFVIDFARRLFGQSAGGPAKVSILASGLMGSLSGSAVANTATTGTFTIPLMRSAGFRPHVAGGIESAASSGGALVPPVMGAGAYMMLEIVSPPVTYLEIVRAALLPAVLYYFSLFLTAHFWAKKLGARGEDERDLPKPPEKWAGFVFFGGLTALIAFILAGTTVFRAVTLALGVVLVTSAFHPKTRVTLKRTLEALVQSARGAVALIAASAAVGIIIGVVTLTGVGSKLPATILPLAQDNLFLALVLIMVSSIVLGMGLPSVVCYLLLATLIGPALGDLGVVPLGAHLFIFYFGLMSMVTPPVALAAYTAASIAGSPIMKTAFSGFRFALVGFALPFLFVYRPELLMLASSGEPASIVAIVFAFIEAALGIIPLAAALAGHLFAPLNLWQRLLFGLAAILLFFPVKVPILAWLPVSPANLVGLAILVAVAWQNRRAASPAAQTEP